MIARRIVPPCRRVSLEDELAALVGELVADPTRAAMRLAALSPSARISLALRLGRRGYRTDLLGDLPMLQPPVVLA